MRRATHHDAEVVQATVIATAAVDHAQHGVDRRPELSESGCRGRRLAAGGYDVFDDENATVGTSAPSAQNWGPTVRATALQGPPRLKSLGLRLSIDDFGTGYSSLAYVDSFPIDELKIHQSFIANVAEDQQRPLVVAMVNLAHALSLDVVADEVERADRSSSCGGWDAASARAPTGAIPSWPTR